MPFEKGHKKFEGEGRPPGAKAKNALLRDLLRDFCIDKFADYVQAFEQLSPKEKCDEYSKALQFVVPKVSSITFDDESKASNALQHLRIIAEYKRGEEDESTDR